jgi:hypothetical protein
MQFEIRIFFSRINEILINYPAMLLNEKSNFSPDLVLAMPLFNPPHFLKPKALSTKTIL